MSTPAAPPFDGNKPALDLCRRAFDQPCRPKGQRASPYSTGLRDNTPGRSDRHRVSPRRAIRQEADQKLVGVRGRRGPVL
jgi:hypothetical protein